MGKCKFRLNNVIFNVITAGVLPTKARVKTLKEINFGCLGTNNDPQMLECKMLPQKNPEALNLH